MFYTPLHAVQRVWGIFGNLLAPASASLMGLWCRLFHPSRPDSYIFKRLERAIGWLLVRCGSAKKGEQCPTILNRSLGGKEIKKAEKWRPSLPSINEFPSPIHNHHKEKQRSGNTLVYSAAEGASSKSTPEIRAAEGASSRQEHTWDTEGWYYYYYYARAKAERL